jgi:hypothetical protein
MCPQSLFINIFGKIKRKEFVFSLRTTGKGIEKRKKKETPEVS